MKLEEVLQKAKEKGIDVKVKKTIENGWNRLRVHEITIDGVTTKYSGSKGNTAIRAALGLNLSRKERASRKRSAEKYATRKHHRKAKKRAPKGIAKLSQAQMNKIKRINRMLQNKKNKERVRIPKAREKLKREGSDALDRSLDNTKMHYEGWVYPANIGNFLPYLASLELWLTTNFLETLVEENEEGLWNWRTNRRFTDEFWIRYKYWLYEQIKILGKKSSFFKELDQESVSWLRQNVRIAKKTK